MMKLQASTIYAIRILQYLHIHRGKVLTSAEIARDVGIPHAFFLTIANQLKHTGLLSSIRGRYGGYVLGKSACDINVYNVVLAIEGDLRISCCFENGKLCPYGEPTSCKIHNTLHNMQDKMIEHMSGVSIADLA